MWGELFCQLPCCLRHRGGGVEGVCPCIALASRFFLDMKSGFIRIDDWKKGGRATYFAFIPSSFGPPSSTPFPCLDLGLGCHQCTLSLLPTFPFIHTLVSCFMFPHLWQAGLLWAFAACLFLSSGLRHHCAWWSAYGCFGCTLMLGLHGWESGHLVAWAGRSGVLK